ncbi:MULTISPECIES: class I SAM-dependent methyltransferase [Ensifer]|jgi:O-methyltransferase involved in polyketide biosynthesis|uniref:Class I SAM-dependent methyltransferase n=1 Tax=Ensifer canadensis TaxID=555315 RepID=A0AAW4FFW8_9HYPH|nr:MULTISPECIES: class I SAM-dependent methyltransferase [Ensifer]AHK43064.1 putative polyketide synthesis O-methyltransferase, TcmP type protein [Ensifer adhaerens OV14]MDP9628830.1 O-methyltransferase involved in polyketide biosynthesis [Ensifer adhaerens]KQU98440.1 methyltransferase [Ensifer sp. Root31]KQW63199.1 methyltransferase [Ensifer sp. Root1252]KQW85215.1 methyltransferase [Ensifer sp. Root127]
MDADGIGLSGAQETLLITLQAKAAESALPDSLLRDHFAADAMRRLGQAAQHLDVGHDMTIGIAMRAYLLDQWTRAFVTRHPDATVLHLGCGLDSRVFRVDPPDEVRWFDVDFPDVMTLRRTLYPDRANYTQIASSVTEAGWLAAIPDDAPAIVVAEGVLPYLAAEDVYDLLRRLLERLPAGEVVFDGYSHLGIQLLRFNPAIRATGAALRWGIDDPRMLERQVPGLSLLEEVSDYDPSQIERMSAAARIAIQIFSVMPMLQRMGRLLRYRF